MLTFRQWQLVIFLNHAAAAVAVLALVLSNDNDWKIPVFKAFNLWSREDSSSECSDTTPCTVTENRRFLDQRLSVGTFVPLFSFVSASHHLWMFVANPQDESRKGWLVSQVRAGVNVVRWADYSISASLMLLVNSLLWVAPQSVQSLSNWFVLQFLVVICGYGSEVAWASSFGAGRPNLWHAKTIFLAASAAFGAVWAVSWDAFASSMSDVTGVATVGINLEGTGFEITPNDPPFLVYGVLVWLFVSFCFFPVVHGYRIWKESNASRWLQYETAYGILSLIAKIPLLLIFATGVFGRNASTSFATLENIGDNAGDDPDEAATASPGPLMGALFGGIIWCTLLGYLMYRDLRKKPQAKGYKIIVPSTKTADTKF